jgi:hypothetical protein
VTRYDVVDQAGDVLVTAAAAVNEVDVIGLSEGSEVALRVIAHNDIGASTPSAPAGPVTILGPPATFTDLGSGHPFFAEINWLVAEGVAYGFHDGAFRPSNPVSRDALAAFLYRLAGRPPVSVPTTPTFSDVDASYVFVEEIEWLASVGLADGFDDGTFRPREPVTRQALAAFLHRLAGSPVPPPPPRPTFSDVGPGHPFESEIEWLAWVGLGEGFADGTFRPGEPVARQALAAFLHRYSTQLAWPPVPA